ncbi:MAG: isoleucine--tRNA ligase, partial [Candidatus Kapaibacterium sp.]
MFPQLSDSDRISYPALEREILEFWIREKIFEKSVDTRPEEKTWTFYEGPPTVNGVPGIHHVLARTLKDLSCRYKTMCGHRVHRKAGWDTHGLPVEIALEKALGLKEKGEIETKIGVAEFNRQAKELVYSHIDKPGGWRELTERMGYWVNMDDPYITCTNNYIESLWWALKTMFDKNLIYRGFKVVPQCPHCETPLSSHELAQGYEDVRDPNLYVKVRVQAEQKTGHGIDIPDNSFFLVWTTTPWTLISNVAVAVGADIDYLMARDQESGETYIFAASRRDVLDSEHQWIIEAEFKGKDIERVRYERLFDSVPVDKEAFYVTLGSFVSTGDGTGIVHIAPAFGQDDYEISKVYDLPVVQPVTPGGRFTDAAGKFAGRMVKTIRFDDREEEGADKDIVIDLKERGLVHHYAKDYLHSYPHCWRCDNPLIYFARDSWYIKTTEFANKMIAANKTIRWQTEEIGSGRFGNWLEDNKDWSLSRDRYWGTPLPIWVNVDDPNDMFAVGSIEELRSGELEVDGKTIPVDSEGVEIDLHKPFVDHILFHRDGKTYRRTPELIDVWFDSGSMPFAQWHYPFENKEKFEQHFPADFISEGVDQTRGWFYTLHAIGTSLFDSVAYKSVLVNDMVLDDSGKKMSKSRGNVIDPFMLLDKYGADATRWYMITASPPWTPLTFKEEDLFRVVISDFFRALENTYKFFTMYANIDGFTYAEDSVTLENRTELDRWILSVMNTTLRQYRTHMENMDPTRAMRLVQEFTVEHLSNWYVRRNRRRFWKGEMSVDKLAAYQTLYEALVGVAKMMAP